MNRKSEHNWMRSLSLLLIALGVIAFWNPASHAQDAKDAKKQRETVGNRVEFKVFVEPKEAKRGTTVKLTIKAHLTKDDYYTYPYTIRHPSQTSWNVSVLKFGTLENGGFRPKIKEELPKGIQPVWSTFQESPKPKFVVEKSINVKEWKQTNDYTLTMDIAVREDAAPGEAVLPIAVLTQVCDDRCINGPIQLPPAKFTVTDEEPATLPEKVKEQLKTTEYTAKIDDGDGGGDDGVGGDFTSKAGFVAFILAGIFWGAVSLVTPCVFPMIPITVSYFLKQSEKENHKPVVMAAIYCVTIVIVLTIAAVALLTFFQKLSQNPLMNLVIGGLFIFFALSLFGMYDIRLPNFMLRFTSSREGQGGYIGTIFMALTFTIISFACVAPFLGGFGGTAATSNITPLHRIFGGLAFSITFAAPFFVLALFPALLRKMPQSGGWLNTVKVVMGFLELAAAIKFLRAGELVMTVSPVIFTYDFCLGLYVALCFVCGLYLLGVFRMGHDETPESISVPRMLFSMLFLGLAIYLTPALFKVGEEGKAQRPSGEVFAWLDSFLLPEEQESELNFTGDLKAALAKARERNQLVFVDFTGVTCANCKYNERNVFTEPSVRELLEQYTLVALYTDQVPARFYPAELREKYGVSDYQQDAQENKVFQSKAFNTVELPLYVILEPTPDGYKELRRTGGKINSTSSFISFLSEPLQKEAATIAEKNRKTVAVNAE